MALITFENLPDTSTPLNAENLNNNFQTLNPQVGSVLITYTNTNPSSNYGGTWTLIDKEFTSNYGSNTTNYWTNSTNAECTGFYWIRSGHTIHVAITLETKVSIADSQVELGTLNISNLGITSTIFTRRFMGYSDDGDAIMGCSLGYNSGTLYSQDIFPHGTLASGSTVIVNIDLITTNGNMVDEKCSKFFWRRTA